MGQVNASFVTLSYQIRAIIDCKTVVFFANASDAVNSQTKGLERVPTGV